ncbi:MAG: hypothetical protein UY04_C0015G0008 [Parcubacteria group bacterium GW2011_GWA2_47_7]|nr:MAG: hypothetical protein UY04_C0015G0008 [Parcubacteria group bacterium GW2011_GWA2_47_7]
MFYVTVSCFALLFIAPTIASAQYVPVNDAQLISDFGAYATKFDTYAKNMDNILKNDPDSLKNLITDYDLTMAEAGGECKRGDNIDAGPGHGIYDAFAYTYGPWASSSDATALYPTPLPKTIPKGGGYVQVNYSQSLRCLLTEQVEWQKLGLSLQIHQLLKSYIADAQTAQLNNQLMNKISAANINYGNQGNTVNNNGAVSTNALYYTNPSQSIYDVKSRQLDHALDQAAADPTSGNPAGSWGIFPDWRTNTVANMANNERSLAEDPFNYTMSITQSNFTDYMNVGDSQKFMQNYDDPASKGGGFMTFGTMLRDAPNSPLGAATLGDMMAQNRMIAQEEAKKGDMISTGWSSAKECSGRPDDPYCLEQQNSTAVTPSGEIGRSIGDSAGSGNQQVRDTKTLDAGAGNASENQTTEIAQSGLLGYDTTPLQISQTAVTELIKEFYDAIDIAYFGVHQDTREWAEGTMLMIYDEMKFDPTSTAVVVTDGNDSVDTGYSGQ